MLNSKSAKHFALFFCLSLLTKTSDAFSPSAISNNYGGSLSSALHSSVVKEFLTSDEQLVKKLQADFNRQQPKSNKKKHNRRKHDYALRSQLLQEEADLKSYSLHSSAVSNLHKGTSIVDVVRAIKRAQSLHDVHDLSTIATFLIDKCDKNWGYGFRGSVLSRLAVAALHMNQHDIARKAIKNRRVHERPSMQPHESAAIVRGLFRLHKVEEGWHILEDELRLPMPGMQLSNTASKELLKHRAYALTNIASRHFHEGKPHIAAVACEKLIELGPLINQSTLSEDELSIPWGRLVDAASECNKKVDARSDNGSTEDGTELPSNLVDYVLNAKAAFSTEDKRQLRP
jgi:hypothetical protein